MSMEPEDSIPDWVYPSGQGGEAIKPDGNLSRMTDRNLLCLKTYTATGNLVQLMRGAGYQGSDENLWANG